MITPEAADKLAENEQHLLRMQNRLTRLGLLDERFKRCSLKIFKKAPFGSAADLILVQVVGDHIYIYTAIQQKIADGYSVYLSQTDSRREILTTIYRVTVRFHSSDADWMIVEQHLDPNSIIKDDFHSDDPFIYGASGEVFEAMHPHTPEWQMAGGLSLAALVPEFTKYAADDRFDRALELLQQ